ncbi:hypothetical protein H7J08_22220 [Mycobacterium frederiksbergense]|uniref:Uncharacterized protein n=1 Tax=Mycolicibacterium frederiksbergense TaxID=117567 RepID=A0A6H0S0E5_9MYCO|nr:hypothetical protein [Mycolicibacterium frederiksbergense]MCV7047353.1 hypothetical protein [Mycolicibacterium frederiksbergense]QIV80670.1 hypothetical protein EXE63_07065 [Mycolicibacterium frederiksbergense]
MSEPLTARQRLAAELRHLHINGGKRPYKDIVRRARAQSTSFSFSTSSAGEWLNGTSVPDPVGKLAVFVKAMTGRDQLDDALRRLHHDAARESRPTPGRRPRRTSATAAAVTPSHIPRLDAVHYVDIDRLYDLVLSHGNSIEVPDLDWTVRRGPGHVRFRRTLVEELDTVALCAKRFVHTLDLRQLQQGDLLIFDTQVRTRNGVAPDQNIRLTGDLNRDPHVYIQRRGVRIVLPLKPEMITTDTAYGFLSEGTTRLAGVCRIKHRVTDEGERRRMRATDKVQYLGTPLVLGSTDIFSEHADLRESPVFNALDVETDGTHTIGPWLGPFTGGSGELIE